MSGFPGSIVDRLARDSIYDLRSKKFAISYTIRLDFEGNPRARVEPRSGIHCHEVRIICRVDERSELTLHLLMLWVLTDNSDLSFSSDYLALFAHRLY